MKEMHVDVLRVYTILTPEFYEALDEFNYFHDYAFSYEGSSVTFYADGEPMSTYEGGLPDTSMKLYINSWYPTWLPGEKPSSDRYAYVDWIEY